MTAEFDHEVVCIGAGPANLAIAVALEDEAPGVAAHTTMFEAADEIAWQPGLLTETARSQVHFVKDLATPRDPKSRFTFLNHLRETGRLDDFVNSGVSSPLRVEVSRYHRWVAEQFACVDVRLGAAVRSIDPVRRQGGVCGWRIEVASGEVATARQVVIGVGRTQHRPAPLATLETDRVIHGADFLERIAEWDHAAPRSIAIIGSSQSAAELTLEAGRLFPQARRSVIMRSVGMAAYETSKFTNELFFPGYTSAFFDLEEGKRRAVLDQMHRANYSGLADHTIEALYEQKYLADFKGDDALRFRPLTELSGAALDRDGLVRLSLLSHHDGQQEEGFDLVLLGTGFDNAPPALVRGIMDALDLQTAAVDRDYRLDLGPGHHDGACHILGINEATHGIADTLLSVQASRAGEVAARIIETAAHERTQESMLRRHAPEALVSENGVQAARLLPAPLTTPFEASWCLIEPGTASTPHTHHEAEIFVAVEGEAVLETDGQRRVFRKGDTAFFAPGVRHQVINSGSRDFTMYSIWWDDAMSLRQLRGDRTTERKIA